MSKIIVTGGLGFIGSHTVVELLQKNYEVIIVDNLSNSSLEVLDGIALISGKKPKFCLLDLTDQAAVFEFFKEHIDTLGIIHFAAFKAVGESVDNPLRYYENNLYSLINIVKASEELAMKLNFIFSSSCTVYGEATSLPINEHTALPPAVSPYGNTKQICEEILKDTVAASTLLNCISLRYFNPIGAHPSGHIGELPLGKPQNLVPYITQTAVGILDHLTVFGKDYKTPDGTCIRDYIDVVDLAKAHVASLEALEQKRIKNKFEVFNLGTGRGTSVLEVINTFESVTQKELNYSFGDKRSGDVEAIYANTEKANQLLQWTASTPLSESLHNAWKWEEKIRSNTALTANLLEQI